MVINLNNQISYKPGLCLGSFWNQSLASGSQDLGVGSGDFLLLRRQGGCPECLPPGGHSTLRGGVTDPEHGATGAFKESPTWEQLPDWEHTCPCLSSPLG